MLAAIVLAVTLNAGCNIGCWFVPCDLAIDVDVSVKDPSGRPVPGVHVIVLGSEGETDGSGAFHAGGVTHSETIDVVAEKRGYKTYHGDKPYKVYRVEIILEPDSSSRPTTATWTVTQ